MEVKAKSISKRSLFKLYFNTFGFGLFLFTLVMGVFALFGSDTIAWNDVHYTGITGLLISIPLGLFIALWFTLFLWLVGIFGMWINSKFYGLNVVFKDVSPLPTETPLPEASQSSHEIERQLENDLNQQNNSSVSN